MQVFDRAAVRAHRQRSAAQWTEHDFLKREVADRLLDRLRDVNRSFASALDLGCHGGTLAERLPEIGKVERLVQCDAAPAMARRAAAGGWPALAADEEALPFAPRSFDLALSVLSLHWVNDLPGTLIQLRTCLRPDGLLLAALLGGESLHELRVALMEAELEVTGGLSPRISPFAEVRDCGGLLQRAGFALPVVDQDEITVTYADPSRCCANCAAWRRRTLFRNGRREWHAGRSSPAWRKSMPALRAAGRPHSDHLPGALSDGLGAPRQPAAAPAPGERQGPPGGSIGHGGAAGRRQG